MKQWFKKYKLKIGIFLCSLLSIFTLFLGINKSYAYTTNQLSYTIDSISKQTNDIISTTTINNIEGYYYNNYGFFDFGMNLNSTTNVNLHKCYLMFNYYICDGTNFINFDNSSTSVNVRFFYNNGNSNNYTQIGNMKNSSSMYSATNDNFYTFIGIINVYSDYNVTNNKLYLNLSNYSYGFFITNIDIVPYSDIGLQQYYDTYYGQIEDNYTQLQSDYNDLQDNYEDLENDYNRLDSSYESLSSEYNDLQEDYTALLDNYNSIDNSLLSILVGNNYFTKSNINFSNTNSTNNVYPTPSGNLYNSTYFTSVDNSSLFDNILYTNIALSKLLDTQSFIFGDNGVPNIYTDKFSYITISPTYLMPYALKHYVGSADSILHLLAYDYYQWNEPNNVMAKYINISIVSSIDLTISVNLINQDGSITYLPITRNTDTQNYEIVFNSDDSRIVRDIFIECKYLNNTWVTAEKVISNINYVNDNNYTIGFNNGYDSGVTDMRSQVDDLNNQLIQSNAQITDMQLQINALNEQISSFSSDYGINNMLWTIGSTPFESFKQIWNVNLFGVNISRAITGFITAIIVLFVVKKFFL